MTLLPRLTACIFNRASSEFELRKGPVFANIVLADEINQACSRGYCGLWCDLNGPGAQFCSGTVVGMRRRTPS